MKKTLVALAVAAVAATSANAAVVYDQDGSKVEVGGSLRLMLLKEGDKRGDLKNAGSRLVVKGSQDLGNGLSALANVELRFENTHKDAAKNGNSNFGDVNTKRLYAGFKQDGVGTLTFGRQLTNGDDVQLGDYAYEWGGNNNLTGASDKSVKFRSAQWNGFSFGVDYLFGNADKSVSGYKNGYGAALFYTTALAQDVTLNLNAGLTRDKLEAAGSSETVLTTTKWRTAAEILVGNFGFAANYGQDKVKGVDGRLHYLLVGAKYKVAEPSTVYAQWKRLSVSGSDIKTNTYVAGVDYKLHKNVITFAEYARVKTTDMKAENNYGVGLRVFF
ncbi:porin [Testudinibacter sp. TR-2022]|uniref:porin n=1 Tax=Testudinibacter sp. TR-2022 TaxID=2585029 RepID=UPI0011182767|nr:porin [Testudinibacter sp. TR-2022]TNH02664.1 porin [Pasteurellaceae bacterium Phil31]TNH10087.1 porin [Testudinibacter sp. TR-2022]TNH12471.1 porin [Testudinibacter sp. TR-2022]